MDSRLFWKAAALQVALVGVLFALLAVALSEDFFDDWGLLVGPLAWLACSLVTGRVLGIGVQFALFAAIAGGVAAAVVDFAGPHWLAIVAGIGVFAASAASLAAGDREQAATG